MCLNKPVKIPKGSDGASVYIAYAQDDSGSGFSYTPAESRNYISFVTKKGAVSQSDFTTWTLYQGEDGSDGSNGTGISNIYVSDGVTAIGGTVYTVNTVVVLLSTGTYINAGEIQLLTPTWNDITLLNGWTNGTGVNVAQYSVHGGFLYLRGRINFSGASSDQFATLASVGNTGTLYTSGATDHAGATFLELDQHSLITLDSTGNITATSTSSTFTGTRLLLDSIAPISIR
jgi:hypothetical protein